MRGNVAVRARSSREIHDRIADPYKRTLKHPQPVVCSGCGALFSKGRWRWTPRPPKRAARELCQACRRMKDAYPAGVVTLRVAYLRGHADEIIALARREEKAETEDHPMHRIMAVEHGRDRLDAGPALVGIAERERKPFAPDRRLSARVRGVRRHKGGIRQQASPSPPELDQVVAVGAIAVQEHDELPGLAGARLDSWSIKYWTVEVSHFWISFSPLS